MTEQELIELLAEQEHDSWSRWRRWLIQQSKLNSNNSLTIPIRIAERWKRLMDTPYAELSEQEKQSDRDEVAHILPIINKYVDEKLDALRKAPQIGESREVIVKWNRGEHAKFGEFGFDDDETEAQPT